MVHFTFAAGSEVPIFLFSAAVENLLELDINTAIVRNEIYNPTNIISIYKVLADLAKEISMRGDVE